MNQRNHTQFGMIVTITLLMTMTSTAWMPRLLAAAPAAKSSKRAVKVIVYNVQFLPGLARIVNQRKDPEYRARTIGEKLASYDIVGLNEVFDNGHRKLLLDQLRKAWGKNFSVIVSPKPDDGRFIGGCAIASRLPFIETHGTLYTACSTPEKYGFAADGFAAKGAIHARIKSSRSTDTGGFIDVFVTHLESKDSAARHVQYKELAGFVRDHSDPTRPTLIMGDMNTRGNPRYRDDRKSAYHTMLSTYRKARPDAKTLDLWPTLNKGEGGTSDQTSVDGGKRIDYIFLSNPSGGRYRLRPLAARVNPFRDPRVVALSDHSAVEAEITWRGE